MECYAVPLTVVLHIFVAGHISYYRRKYRQQDRTVFAIQLRCNEEENGQQQMEQYNQSVPIQLNTTRYNKILFEVIYIILNSIFFISIFILWNVISNQHEGHQKLFINYYLFDFFPLFILNVIIPCIYYVRNRNARVYIKTLFHKK